MNFRDHKLSGNLKGPALASVGLLSVLVLLSLVFFKERMLFIDAPHNLFLIINDGHFHIEEHRIGSFISQLLPFIGSKLHLPLRVLMMLYSAGFTLFFWAVGMLLVFRYRNYQLAILIALYLTLFASATFYWPNNEVHQGMGWLMLAFAANFHMAHRRPQALLCIPFFIASFYLALWTHPLIMLVAMYLWFFFWIGGIHWPFGRNKSILLTLVLFVLAFFKFNTGMHHGYDSSKIELVTHIDPQHIWSVFSSPQLALFLRHCVTNYWLAVLLFVVGISGLVYLKKYLLAVLTIGAAAGYLLLICITFWDGQSSLFYIESEYMPLTVMCVTPFIYFVLPRIQSRLALGLLCGVFCIRLAYILLASTAFTGRVAVLENIHTKLEKKHITKAVITGLPKSTDSSLIMNWGGPVESMLYSALKGTKPQTTFIFQTTDEIKGFNTGSKDTLLGCWEKRPAIKLNANYFALDTATTYQIINYDELMK